MTAPPVLQQQGQQEDPKTALRKRIEQASREKGVPLSPEQVSALVDYVSSRSAGAPQGAPPPSGAVGQSPHGFISPNVKQVAQQGARTQQELNEYNTSQSGWRGALKHTGQNIGVEAFDTPLELPRAAMKLAGLVGVPGVGELADRNARYMEGLKWSPDEIAQVDPEGRGLHSFAANLGGIAAGAVPVLPAVKGAGFVGNTAAKVANFMTGNTQATAGAKGAQRLLELVGGGTPVSALGRTAAGFARGAGAGIAAQPYSAFQSPEAFARTAGFGGVLGSVFGRNAPGMDAQGAPRIPKGTDYNDIDIEQLNRDTGVSEEVPVVRPGVVEPQITAEPPTTMAAPETSPRAQSKASRASVLTSAPRTPDNYVDWDKLSYEQQAILEPQHAGAKYASLEGTLDKKKFGAFRDRLGFPFNQPTSGKNGKVELTPKASANMRPAGAIKFEGSPIVGQEKAPSQAPKKTAAPKAAETPTATTPVPKGDTFNPGAWDALDAETRKSVLRASGTSDENMLTELAKRPFAKLTAGLRTKLSADPNALSAIDAARGKTAGGAPPVGAGFRKGSGAAEYWRDLTERKGRELGVTPKSKRPVKRTPKPPKP